jgi:hypothetical protein
MKKSDINYALIIATSLFLVACGGSSDSGVTEQPAPIDIPTASFVVPDQVSSDLNNSEQFLNTYTGKWQGEIDSIGDVTGYITKDGLVFFEINYLDERLRFENLAPAEEGFSGSATWLRPFDEEVPAVSYSAAISANPNVLELTLTPNAADQENILSAILFPSDNANRLMVEELRNVEISTGLLDGTIAISETDEVTISGSGCEYLGKIRNHDELTGMIEVALSRQPSDNCDDDRELVYGLAFFDEQSGVQMIDMSSEHQTKFSLSTASGN